MLSHGYKPCCHADINPNILLIKINFLLSYGWKNMKLLSKKNQSWLVTMKEILLCTRIKLGYWSINLKVKILNGSLKLKKKKK